MTLGERAALRVLTGEADLEPLDEKGAEGQRLHRRPIDAGTVLDGLAASGEDAAHGLVRSEALGDIGDLAANLMQDTEINACKPTASSFLGMADARPFAVEPVGTVRAIGVARRELFLEESAKFCLHALDLGARQQALIDELVGIGLHDRRMLADA